MEGDDDDLSDELTGGDAFDELEARLLARADKADEAERAAGRDPYADEDEPEEPEDESDDEESDEEAPEGSADEEEREEGAGAGAAPGKPEEGPLTLKGPWGAETVDTRTPEGRARAVELAQKGRNYDELVAARDADVRRRAEQLAEQRAQEARFDLYRRFGLVRVNARGESEWTEKGLRYAQAVQEGKETPLEDQPGAAKASQERAPDDDELETLAETVLRSPDDAEAKTALVDALRRIRKQAEERASRAASEAVDGRFAKLSEAQRAREAQASAATQAQALRSDFETRVATAVQQAQSIAGDSAALEMARRRVSERIAQFAEAERRGETVPADFLDAAVRDGVADVARYYDGIMARGVKRFQGAVRGKRQAPPATGGGSAAPVSRRPPANGRSRLFDDSFQDEMEEKALRG